MPRVRRVDNAAKKSSISSSADEDPGTPPPQQRNAANARERARMRVLSRAFCRLKTTLPWVPADTKLSKLDTLRLATSYIAHLRDSLLTPAAAAAAAAATAASTRQPIGPQSPSAEQINGVASPTGAPSAAPKSTGAAPLSPRLPLLTKVWPLTFQPKLAEPWLSRRTTVNGAHANQPMGSHRGAPCTGMPLSLPPEHHDLGVPLSPPSSSGEEDETDTEMTLDQPWQMMRLCQRDGE